MVAAGVGAAACAGDEDLNPQPLPPGGGDEKNSSSGTTAEVPGSSGSSSNGGSSGTSGFGGSSSSSGDLLQDAGTDDAGDAGADANDGAPK